MLMYIEHPRIKGKMRSLSSDKRYVSSILNKYYELSKEYVLFPPRKMAELSLSVWLPVVGVLFVRTDYGYPFRRAYRLVVSRRKRLNSIPLRVKGYYLERISFILYNKKAQGATEYDVVSYLEVLNDFCGGPDVIVEVSRKNFLSLTSHFCICFPHECF